MGRAEAGARAGAGIHVLWCRARPGAAAGEARQLLDEATRERIAALHRPADRDLVATAQLLLRTALSRHLDVPVGQLTLTAWCRVCGRAGHGKPDPVRARDGALVHTSLSHAGEIAVVALTRLGPVGVDTEPVRPLSAPAPRPGPGADLVRWVRTEAVLKATGHGLSVPLEEVEVTGAVDPPRLVRWPTAHPPQVVLHDLDLAPGQVSCVALLADAEPEVLVREGPAGGSAGS